MIGSVPSSAQTLLGVAAATVAFEALAFITVASLNLADVSGSRLGFGLGAGILLIAYGLGLLVAARQVQQRRRWARSPLILAQIIQLLLANDARDGAAWVTPALAVSAVVVLACLLAPPVTRALSADGSV